MNEMQLGTMSTTVIFQQWTKEATIDKKPHQKYQIPLILKELYNINNLRHVDLEEVFEKMINIVSWKYTYKIRLMAQLWGRTP